MAAMHNTVTINISGALRYPKCSQTAAPMRPAGEKSSFEPQRVKLLKQIMEAVFVTVVYARQSRDVMRRLEINNEIFTACIDKRVEYQDHRVS